MNKFIMSICFKNPTLDSKRKRKVVWQIIGVHHLTKMLVLLCFRDKCLPEASTSPLLTAHSFSFYSAHQPPSQNRNLSTRSSEILSLDILRSRSEVWTLFWFQGNKIKQKLGKSFDCKVWGMSIDLGKSPLVATWVVGTMTAHELHRWSGEEGLHEDRRSCQGQKHLLEVSKTWMEKKVVLPFSLREGFHKVCPYTNSYINVTGAVLEGDIGASLRKSWLKFRMWASSYEALQVTPVHT